MTPDAAMAYSAILVLLVGIAAILGGLADADKPPARGIAWFGFAGLIASFGMWIASIWMQVKS